MEAHSDEQDVYTWRSTWDACRSLSDGVMEAEYVKGASLQGGRDFVGPVMGIEGQLEEKKSTCGTWRMTWAGLWS